MGTLPPEIVSGREYCSGHPGFEVRCSGTSSPVPMDTPHARDPRIPFEGGHPCQGVDPIRLRNAPAARLGPAIHTGSPN